MCLPWSNHAEILKNSLAFTRFVSSTIDTISSFATGFPVLQHDDVHIMREHFDLEYLRSLALSSWGYNLVGLHNRRVPLLQHDVNIMYEHFIKVVHDTKSLKIQEESMLIQCKLANHVKCLNVSFHSACSVRHQKRSRFSHSEKRT